jgi:hypothetical protein
MTGSNMRTIQTRGTITEDRQLIVDLPPDVSPGDHQIVIVIDDVPSGGLSWDLAAIAQHGGALDWLHDEPDLYSDEDGEPV